jgi:DNA helicase INO80
MLQKKRLEYLMS